MELKGKIYVAGHRGLVGSAIMRRLTLGGYTNTVTRAHAELDLTNQSAVEAFFKSERPEYVFLAAAKVGGIHANNTYRADFIYQNLMIDSNIIHASYRHGVKKLMFLGSSCIYPKRAPQPMKEEHLLTGLLEPTNEPYAIAKIAGIKMCDAYKPVWNKFYERHADQSLRSWRQLRSKQFARTASPDPQGARSQDSEGAGGRGVGHWFTSARVSL